MKITQIRNATIIIEVQHKRILVDPMLARQSSLPKLRYFKSQQRNPLVELPMAFKQLEDSIDFALITHCQKGHFDHLDRAGVRWLRENRVTTFCTQHDLAYLNKKGISTRVLPQKRGMFLDGHIELVPATHTTGWLTPFMEHGTGYFLNFPDEPSLYLMGDTVLTDTIRDFVTSHQPDYIVAPTGKAQFDIGAPLLLSEAEILELAELSSGCIIANHMDALDHCRISRSDLVKLVDQHNLKHRFRIPKDGETITICV